MSARISRRALRLQKKRQKLGQQPRVWTRPLSEASELATWYLQLVKTKSRIDRLGHALMTTAAALAALLLGGCREATIAPAASPSPQEVQGPMDITFLVAADTHFGVKGMEEMNRQQIEAMHSLPGTAWPGEGLGKIAEPHGVLLAGDLTDGGSSNQWEQFVTHYGLSGGDGLLKWPVFEGTGNHDRPYTGSKRVPLAVANRHGGLPYSMQWQNVRIINLDVYPDAANRDYLTTELERVGRDAPVVIYFHYGLAGPYSDWWSQSDKQAFYEVIRGHNIIAIYHGHFHATAHYKWKGFDVYNVGSVRHGWHSFCVARLTDQFFVTGSWNFGAGTWDWWHIKPINGAVEVAERRVIPLMAPKR